MRFSGRPILGAIAGFFLGVSVAVLLQQFSVRPLDNLSVVGLPLVGLVAGLALAYWAPLRRSRSTSPPARVAPPTPPETPPA